MSKFYKLDQELAKRKDITPGAKIVYSVIVDHLTRGMGKYLGTRNLAKKAGLADNTVTAAIAKLFSNQADPVDNGLEFVEICEDRGLPAPEHRELADELRSLDVPVEKAVIPSIRSIKRVELPDTE